MNSPLQIANETLAENAPEINCIHRPGFHISAPAGWLNDPNGLCFHNGVYHVFYQHHPFSGEWGPMHWGHATSKDMVHWEHQPVALAPGEEGMCFSGSAISHNNELALFYTGHQWLGEEGNQSQIRQIQCLATSSNGIDFQKQGVVLPQPPKAGMVDFRDPKVWYENDCYHMVIGMRDNGKGQVGYYQTKDLKRWQFINVLAEAKPSLGYMWECPDFFAIDDQHVLICSPQGIKAEGCSYRNLHQNGYMLGKFDPAEGTFDYGDFIELDHGHDFYASQTFLAEDNRRIAIAWMDMWESSMPTRKNGWAGALTLPRELRLENNRLEQHPVKGLEVLRLEEKYINSISEVRNETINTGISGDLLEIKISFSLAAASAERFGLLLRCGEQPFEQTMVGYDAMSGRVFLDRSLSGQGVQGVRSVATESEDSISLHIYLDRSSVEMFINQGESTISSRIYPSETSLDVKLFAENGSIEVEHFQCWELKDIWAA